MNASNHKWIGLADIVVILLLPLTGCQPAPNVQQASSSQQNVAPSAVPTALIVVKGEEQCSITEMKSLADGTPVSDPQLEQAVKAQVLTYNLDCGNPYITEKCIEIQDTDQKGTVFHFTSLFECVTHEGGVWKGTCDATLGEKAVCTGKGDGKYKGLQLYTDADLNTYHIKYQVTRLVEE